MENNIKFKELWSQQKVSQPKIEEILQQVKVYKRSQFFKLLITNFLLLLTSIILAGIWIYFQPKLITTKVGIILTILAMAIFIFSYNKQFTILKNTSKVKQSSDYLKYLTLLHKKQKHLQTTMLTTYFIMLSSGICLYLYEYTVRMPKLIAFVIYGITLSWIAFNWFYLRPTIIKKQEVKLQELIEKLESIDKQFNDK